MKALQTIAFILLVVGGINWGLVGLFQFNLVEELLGGIMGLTSIVYILVGLSAVYIAVIQKDMYMGMGKKKGKR